MCLQEGDKSRVDDSVHEFSRAIKQADRTIRGGKIWWLQRFRDRDKYGVSP